jgi:hypothetical protein
LISNPAANLASVPHNSAQLLAQAMASFGASSGIAGSGTGNLLNITDRRISWRRIRIAGKRAAAIIERTPKHLLQRKSTATAKTASGHQLPRYLVQGAAALAPEADTALICRRGCFGPIATFCTAKKSGSLGKSVTN